MFNFKMNGMIQCVICNTFYSIPAERTLKYLNATQMSLNVNGKVLSTTLSFKMHSDLL